MKTINLSYLIILILASCHSSANYYPPKHSEMSSDTYDNYKTKLESAYSIKDHFEAAIQLANLDAPDDIIFKQLNSGIRENHQNCFRIYEWFKLFEENNFQVNLVRADTTRYVEAYNLCIELLGNQTFIDFQNAKEEKYRMEKDMRVKLDSTKFDQDLISLLEQIEKDDQEVRIKINAKNLSKADEARLLKEMVLTDSINLMKVGAILDEYGYPKKETVGYDLANTVWLVLHHQSDLKVRDKYQKLIEENASEGQITSYNWRSEDIRMESAKK